MKNAAQRCAHCRWSNSPWVTTTCSARYESAKFAENKGTNGPFAAQGHMARMSLSLQNICAKSDDLNAVSLYDVRNEPDNPATPGPESYGKVKPFQVPAPEARQFTISFLWGPFDKNVKVEVGVTIGGLSKLDTAYFDLDEPNLGPSPVTRGPLGIWDCKPPSDRLGLGCSVAVNPNTDTPLDPQPANRPPPGVKIRGEVLDPVPAGYLFYIQLFDASSTLEMNSKSDGKPVVTITENSEGFRLDSIEPHHPQARYEVNWFDNWDVDEQERWCPSWSNDTGTVSFCVMQDSPGLPLENSSLYARAATMDFSAKTTLMYMPITGQPVPVAELRWHWSATAIYTGPGFDRNAWTILGPFTVDIPTNMSKTDEWPKWEKRATDFPMKMTWSP